MAIYAECPICHKKQSLRNRICKCGEDLVRAKRAKRVRYWISYYLPGPGKRQRREAAGLSLDDARAAEGKRLAQRRETPHVLELSLVNKTVKELAAWYLDLPRVRTLKSAWRIGYNLRALCEVLGDKRAGDLRPEDLERYQEARAAAGIAPATVDQEIQVARTMVNRAFDNRLVDGEVVRVFRSVAPMLSSSNANARDQVITHQQFLAILRVLPVHARPPVATAYYTGMRRGEIFSLTWSHVDMAARVIRLAADQTKTGKAREVPICPELHRIFSGLPRSINVDAVFLYRGVPLKTLRRSLATAADRAGVPFGRKAAGGFTFHDLRHTFNTNLRRAGVPESVIMKITGHKTRAMFDRYNTVDLDDAQSAVARLSDHLQSSDHSSDQNKKGVGSD